jgi:DNA polymerase III epsilon subunit-like protein
MQRDGIVQPPVVPAIPTYPWFDQAPAHLRTKNQLAERGLRPVGAPVARVVWRGGERLAYLYDPAEAVPKREPTEAQRAALAKAQEARRTCKGCGTTFGFALGPRFRCDVCRGRSVRDTAAAWLADPNVVLLDLETTGLNGYAVEVAAVDASGAVLVHQRLHPRVPIEPGARAAHGISLEDLAGEPTFDEAVETLAPALGGRLVVAYNAPFEERTLGNELARAPHLEARLRPAGWRCAMRLYARHVGEVRRGGAYRFQKLPGGDHTALGDVRALLAMLRRLAAEP